MNIQASIVSIGNWNTRIFTPDWVSANVFCIPEGKSMNIRLDDKNLTLLFIWEDIQFLPTDNSIEIRTNQVSKETLKQIDGIYKHLANLLHCTPVSAFGYNLLITMSQDEFDKTAVAKIVQTPSISEYVTTSHKFNVIKDGAIRSFEIKFQGDQIEIACNFQYNQIKRLPTDNVVFDLIISELTKFLGYEYKL